MIKFNIIWLNGFTKSHFVNVFVIDDDAVHIEENCFNHKCNCNFLVTLCTFLSLLERVSGLEPPVSSLARRHFTTKLHPLVIVSRRGIEPLSDLLQRPAVTTLATSTNIERS